MKTNFYVNFFMMILMLTVCIHSKAQVTIGSHLDPHEGALMELKEREISATDSTTATKGLLFPKVRLAAYNDLSPLFETASDSQKRTARGMTVYNINRHAVGLKDGLCVWNGDQWMSAMGIDSHVEAPVLGRPINILIYGSDNDGGYDLVGKNKDHGVSLILKNSSLFGLKKSPYSYCPVEGINVLRSSSPTVVNRLDNFDIILISYNFRIPGPILKDSLISFVNRGGVLIHCIERGDFDKTPIAQLHEALFGASFTSKEVKDDMFTLQGNNPYVDGIYRNLTGKYIGRDGGDNSVFILPTKVREQADILAVDAFNQPIAIKHKTKPYFVFGDAGTFCGGALDFVVGYQQDRPVQVSNDGIPQVRTSTDTYTGEGVYNAHFFTNIIMWAINYRLSRASSYTGGN
jgi:hypothetical protein